MVKGDQLMTDIRRHRADSFDFGQTAGREHDSIKTQINRAREHDDAQKSLEKYG